MLMLYFCCILSATFCKACVIDAGVVASDIEMHKPIRSSSERFIAATDKWSQQAARRTRNNLQQHLSTMSAGHLSAFDYSVLVVYVIATVRVVAALATCFVDTHVDIRFAPHKVAVGWWAGRKPMETTDDFFLAGRSANLLTVAISLISGLTSGISFLGSPGYSYQHVSVLY